MNDRDAARYDMFKRVGDFGVAHGALFQPVPPATGPTKAQQLFTQLGTVDDAESGASVMARIKAATKGQQTGAGEFHGGTTSKAVLRDGLMADLRLINRSAGAIAEAQGKPELLASFRMPYGASDEVLVARARAFAEAVGPMKADFLALDHPADFDTALLQRVADFENADSSQNTGQQALSGASATVSAVIQEGLLIVKQLDAMVHNRFNSNAELMGEWATASHVERAAVSAAAKAAKAAKAAAKKQAAPGK
jgi:hypothetical protein